MTSAVVASASASAVFSISMAPNREKRRYVQLAIPRTERGAMRLRITRRPTGTIDGIALDQFHVGALYEVGPQLGCVFLAEGWAEPVRDEAAHVVRPPPVDVHGPVVLVVDDDADVRRFVGHLLEGHGYRIMVARHGAEALQRLREHCPDLIVLDLNMPVMDGWQFLSAQQRLDDQLAAIRVVLLSGSHAAKCDSAKVKAAAFLPKPCDPDDLLRTLRAASRNGSATTEGD